MENDFLKNLPVTKRFLADVHGESNPYLIWKPKKHWSGKVYGGGKQRLEAMAERLRRHNIEWKNEIFFSVHPFGFTWTKDRKGKRTRRWFKKPARCFVVDFDCGTPDERAKQSCLETAENLCKTIGAPYTHLVWSRNGFHLYWTIEEGIDEKTWVRVQKRLADVFGSDPMIILATQDMRLPGTFHWKGNSAGYMVDVAFAGVEPYSLKEFMNLVGVKTQEQMIADALSGAVDSAPTSKAASLVLPGRIENQAGDWSMAGTPNSKVNSKRRREVAEAIQTSREDLHLICGYVGVPINEHTRFCCPYHSDKHPSAGIFKAERAYIFKCQSKRCRMQGDIVELIKRVEGLKGEKKKLYEGVLKLAGRDDLIRGGMESAHGAYLDRNLGFVLSPHSLVCNYTTRTQWLSEFLNSLLEIAKTKIKNPDCKFPASISEIAKHTNQTYRQAAHKLYLCRLAGLIEIASIPDACRESQERFKKARGVKNDTSWHFVPEWTEEKIKDAVEILSKASAKGINTKSCTRETVREAFGEAFEQRVFHGHATAAKRFTGSYEERLITEELAFRMTDSEVEAEFKKLGYPVEEESIEELLRRLEREARENNRQWYGLDSPSSVLPNENEPVRIPDDEADGDGFG